MPDPTVRLRRGRGPRRDKAPSRARHAPAALATAISSSFDGETAISDNDAPRIDAPLYDVRLTQLIPPSSERKALRAKLYIRAPIARARAPVSGLFGAWASTLGGGALAAPGTVFHVSKSAV